LVLDASLPSGLIAGTGDMQYGRTIAFTTLFLFQMFNVFNARSDTHSVVYQLSTTHLRRGSRILNNRTEDWWPELP
jgi:Ca2+-transporting ATPase